MTARLLLDEMYPPLLADTLRDKGHDVLAVAASTELTGADDATVLDAAAADTRCLAPTRPVTCGRTFVRAVSILPTSKIT